MPQIVSVVVPFYNEVDNVSILSDRIDAALGRLDQYDYECIFVDDGSTDGTAVELQRIAAENPRVRPILFKRNYGQSAALLAGMRAAKGEYILTLDGDLQNDPADFPKILDLLRSHDCVCGVRVNRNDSAIRRISSRVANSVRSAILHDGIQDAGCGTKGFRRACVAHIPCFNGVHRFFAVFVRKAGLSIVECPVQHHAREHGQSKYGLHNRLWRGIYDLLGVAWLRRRFVAYEIEDAQAHEATAIDGRNDPNSAESNLTREGA